MSATRLKTGRGKHQLMLVSAGSPTLGGSASSATGQYIKAGSYCKIETDSAGGLQFANITNSAATPTTGDNAYIASAIIFNFSADTFTDKWVNSLTYAEVVTDVVPTIELEDGFGFDSSLGMSIEYADPGNITNGTYYLGIAKAAVKILQVEAVLQDYSTAGTVQVAIGGVNVLSTAISVTSVVDSGTIYTTDSILGTADEVISLTVAGTWSNSSTLTARIDYAYQ